MARLGALALVAAAAAVAAPASAGAFTMRSFHTPGGSIRCALIHDDTGHYSARCDSAAVWAHLPPRPAGCIGDYGQTIRMGAKSIPAFGCASDAVEPGVVLARGRTTRLGRVFTCTNGAHGVRCTNLAGHGWVVTLRSARRF